MSTHEDYGPAGPHEHRWGPRLGSTLPCRVAGCRVVNGYWDEDSDVSVWADASGIWHANAPNPDSALAAILAELTERESPGWDPSPIGVELMAPYLNDDGTEYNGGGTYRETVTP